MAAASLHYPWVWRDGERVPRDEFRIDPFDGGLLFGLGAFETTRTVDGVPWLWPAHVRRMELACKVLGISRGSHPAPTADQVRDFVHSMSAEDVVVRWTLTAGSADRAGASWISVRPLPEPVDSFRLVTCPHRVSTHDPFSSHKTLNYGLRRLAYEEATRAGASDALLLDEEENVLESSTANLFLRVARGWLTPALSGGVLAGTVRERLLSHGEPPSVHASVLCHASLAEAREVFVTNSVRGVVPVTAIDDWQFPVGDETRRIEQWVRQHR